MFLFRKIWYFILRLFFDFGEIVERFIVPPANAGRISTTDLVNRIFMFCEVYSGKTMYPYQEQFSKRVIRSVLENDGSEITALFARQCIPANQKVYMSDGSFKRIADIEQGDNILSLTVDNSLENDVVVDKWSTGVRERLKIKTIRGFEIECSPKHLFLTPQGWREASLLKTRQQFKNSRIGAKGDRRDTLGGETVYHRHQNYCASINAGVFGTQSIGNDRAKLLGYLVSDGHYSKSSIKFTNIKTAFLSEVEKIALSEFNVRIDKEKKGKGFDYHFRAEKDHVNDLMEFLKDIGIYNQVSENKRISKILFNCSEKEISLFLNRLYSGDGWVTSKESGIEIGIGVQSFDIAEEIRFLLHKFGVSCVIQEQFKGKKQKKRFWKIRISRSEDVLRFFERIGYIYGKYPQSIRAKKFAEKNIKRQSYFIDNDVSWDTITSIEQLESVGMFDIETRNNHNFICNGFVVHNSGKSETISLTSGGLLIILPQLANMVMFLDDPRLTMFKDGFWIGIFAPTQRQAQITYGRIKTRIQSKTAQAVLNDPEFRLGFTTSNGQTVALSNGSFVTSISASDGSNIEGESFKLLLLEECVPKGTKILTIYGEKNIEDIKENDYVLSFNHLKGTVENKKVTRSFSQPLFNRKIVTITTDSGKKLICTDNHKIFVKDRGYVRADLLKVNNLMLSYMYATQERSMCDNVKIKKETVCFKSNDFRFSIRRWVNKLSRQEVFKIPTLHNKPVFKTGRLCLDKISAYKTFMPKRTKNSPEFRERFSFMPSEDKLFTRNKILSRFMLPEWEEDSNKRLVRFDDRRSNGILVHGRRFFKQWNDDDSYTRFFSTGKRIISKLVKILWYNCRDTYRQALGKALSLFQGKKQEYFPEINTPLCSGMYGIQDSHNGSRNPLCNVWEDVCTLSVKEKSVLFGGMSKNEQTELFQGLLFEEQIISIEISEHEEIEVYDLTVEDNHNFFAENLLVHNCQDIGNLKITKSIMPMGAAYNATMVKIGTATTFKGNFYEAIQRNKKDMESKTYHSATTRNHFEYDWTVVVKYNPKYAKYIEGQKKKLGENSDSFRMSYKLEWLIERSMFIDIEKFEKNNLEPLFERQFYDMDATHVVGIDVGGKSDSTVITVIEVDWNMPVVQESIQNFETGEDIVYTAYNTYIKDWYEIIGVPDYEEQFSLIMDYLSNFNIARIVIDATKEAALAHRIRANMSCEVIPFVFSTKSKSEIYSYLTAEVETGRARVPGGSNSIQTIEYKKFIEQLAELQKGYSGQYLRVAHSSESGHDDFVDSWCLAVWGCSMAYIPDHTETQVNRFTEKTRMEIKSMKHKNSFTAKRR